MIKSAFILLLAFSLAAALYEPGDNVVLLSAKEFEETVVQSDSVWVVEFFAPWCGHCKKLVPEYKKLGTALQGVVKVGAVNCDENKSLCKLFEVKGYPTVKIITGKASTVYKGERTAKAMSDAVLEKMQEIVNEKFEMFKNVEL